MCNIFINWLKSTRKKLKKKIKPILIVVQIQKAYVSLSAYKDIYVRFFSFFNFHYVRSQYVCYSIQIVFYLWQVTVWYHAIVVFDQ